MERKSDPINGQEFHFPKPKNAITKTISIKVPKPGDAQKKRIKRVRSSLENRLPLYETMYQRPGATVDLLINYRNKVNVKEAREEVAQKEENRPPSNMLKIELSRTLYDMRQQDQIAGVADPAHDLPTSTEIQVPISYGNSDEHCSDNEYLTVDTEYHCDIVGDTDEHQVGPILVKTTEGVSICYSRTNYSNK